MFVKPGRRDPVVRTRARDHALWLIRDHGDQAEAVIAAKLLRRNVTDEDRYRYQLTAKEVKRLRKSQKPSSTALTLWQPRLFSAEGLRRLFGLRAVDRRKHPRS